MSEEKSGPVGLSPRYFTDSEVLDIVSAEPTKVIPLLIPHKSLRAGAWTAAVTQSYRIGLIPQIYMWLKAESNQVSKAAILSSVKDSLPGISGLCSVKSVKNCRVLVQIYESSSSPELPHAG